MPRLCSQGVAYTDNMGFAVPKLASGRQSFSPDARITTVLSPHDDMDFVEGPPTLAVEVRSKGDYGNAAEAALAAKRADYFEAGTKVVWDVDPKAKLIRSYRSTHRISRPYSAGANSPMPNPRSRAGAFLSMRSSPEIARHSLNPTPRRGVRNQPRASPWEAVCHHRFQA